MFVRKKSNRSGTTSVVVIEKRHGKCCYLKTVGVSSDADEINVFFRQGKRREEEQKGLRNMFYEYAKHEEKKMVVKGLLDKIEHLLLNGTQLILDPVYQNIGFDKVNDDILKHLVIAHICQPQSKVATVD